MKLVLESCTKIRRYIPVWITIGQYRAPYMKACSHFCALKCLGGEFPDLSQKVKSHILADVPE